jgi:hypothetical protein
MATFLTSEQSSVRVTIYRKNAESISVTGSILSMDGRGVDATAPSVVALSTQNALGQSGKFSVSLKVPLGFDVLGSFEDDDWVDIEIFRHELSFHIMRGLIDEVRQSTTVSGTGATVTQVTLVGSSFQKVWETTPVWFSGIAKNNNQKELNLKNWSKILAPYEAVSTFLRQYTELLASFGRANWTLPAGLSALGQTFSDLWTYDISGFDKTFLQRQSLTISYLYPSGNVWQACGSWSDSEYCELFTEILPRAGGMAALAKDPDLKGGLPISASQMTVVYRDKPFVTISPQSAALQKLGLGSPFFSLPNVVVPRNHLVAADLGKSGYERYNAFFSSVDLNDTNGVSTSYTAQPLWSPKDMTLHGMRRMDVNTRYIAKKEFYNTLKDGIYGYFRILRLRLRDWYCLNHRYLQGTLSFGRGLPQLKVGTRLTVSDSDPTKTLRFYVEQVSHTFNAAQGTRTTVGVTRGYRGTDSGHLAELQSVVGDYETGHIGGPST